MSEDSRSLNLAPVRKTSDLGVRTLSAAVMVLVAGTALWLGGTVWAAFVALVAVGVLWEWVKLSRAIAGGAAARAVWFVAGVLYVGTACSVLVVFRQLAMGAVLYIALAVIATDVGAYFAGRTFGGPKIAPRISPGKTWAGLAGGIVGATLVPLVYVCWRVYRDAHAWRLGQFPDLVVDPWAATNWGRIVVQSLASGALIAITAQIGDFFESWMKRRAGVKDSGSLIPGHGGFFDRVDGLLAVLFVVGIVTSMARSL